MPFVFNDKPKCDLEIDELGVVHRSYNIAEGATILVGQRRDNEHGFVNFIVTSNSETRGPKPPEVGDAITVQVDRNTYVVFQIRPTDNRRIGRLVKIAQHTSLQEVVRDDHRFKPSELLK